MSLKFSLSGHFRIFPDDKLIIRVPMRANEFFIKLAPNNLANLAFDACRTDQIAAVCVPKLDASIVTASTWPQKVFLQGTPSQCFDCCLMFCHSKPQSLLLEIPKLYLVVVASTRQYITVTVPFERTDLVEVVVVSRDYVILAANVVIDYLCITWPTSKNMVIPVETSNSVSVARKRAVGDAFLGVVELDFAVGEPYRQTVSIFHPGNRSYVISIVLSID